MQLGFGQKGGVHAWGVFFVGVMSGKWQGMGRTQFQRHNLPQQIDLEMMSYLFLQLPNHPKSFLQVSAFQR